MLGIALAQDKKLQGTKIPGAGTHTTHQFSAFVDDSTLFLNRNSQLPRALNIVEEFGRISGLQIQPAKSIFIFLNTAVELQKWHGIPVLAPGDTVRYLGYEVGFRDLSKINWAKRIRSLQRRMATAEKAATTVIDRVDLLNAIVLPSILFTAKAFTPSPEVLRKLVNLQKQFLWRHQLIDDPSRHKMAPDLIFTPREAGGLGLVAIPVAIQTQRVEDAMFWLVSKEDVYKQAWVYWMGLRGIGPLEPLVSPSQRGRRVRQRHWTARREQFQNDIGPLLAPTAQDQKKRQKLANESLPEIVAIAASKTSNLTRIPDPGDIWVVHVELDDVAATTGLPQELSSFWGEFAWADNPWIPDSNAATLTRRKYARISVTTLRSLAITRISRSQYSFRVPETNNFATGHTAAKLQRWLCAILVNSPRLQIGDCLGDRLNPVMRNPPPSLQQYWWEVVNSGIIRGLTANGEAWILLQQQDNGITWSVKEHANADEEMNELEEKVGGIVFLANPLLHGFPWTVPEETRNRSVIPKLKKQVKAWFRRSACPHLDNILQRWKDRSQTDTWVRGHQSQSPKELWTHNNMLTNYQVWVVYRMAAQQLNLHYPGRDLDAGCPQDEHCEDRKITITHIAWTCQRAQAF